MLKQFLNLKLSQKLSPQQIQLMKLIQLPTQAFEQRLKEEMNENPALEAGKEEDDYEKTSSTMMKNMMILMTTNPLKRKTSTSTNI
jgi:DNA-directed RNA polymerase specialized sigma54-like protein